MLAALLCMAVSTVPTVQGMQILRGILLCFFPYVVLMLVSIFQVPFAKKARVPLHADSVERLQLLSHHRHLNRLSV
jgi:hypothetical protein